MAQAGETGCFGKGGCEGQPTAASQQDVQKLENKIQTLLREGRLAREAAQKAESLNVLERKKAADTITKNTAALQRAEEERRRLLESIARQEREAVGDRLRYERSLRYVIGGAIAAFVAIGLLVWFLLRKNRTPVKVTVISRDQDLGKAISDVLIDPTLPQIREALENKREQVFHFTLKDGRRFECRAEMKEAESKPGLWTPVAFVVGDPSPDPVSFTKTGHRIDILLKQGAHLKEVAL